MGSRVRAIRASGRTGNVRFSSSICDTAEFKFMRMVAVLEQY